MDIATFRATQEPIKDLYRRDARAALLTLKAKGSADDSHVTCKVETGRGLALAACAGVSMRAAAAVLEIPIKSAEISAEGDVDLRGTLGVTEGVPVGFKEIRLRFDIDTDAPQNRLTQLMELTDRYCVIFQTIQRSPRTFVKLNRVAR
ncbi:MAG: OsmC family protein [Mesorhizobium sp.]|nr:MAG: OsmC family protein [Mesorhizobium sp.]